MKTHSIIIRHPLNLHENPMQSPCAVWSTVNMTSSQGVTFSRPAAPQRRDVEWIQSGTQRLRRSRVWDTSLPVEN